MKQESHAKITWFPKESDMSCSETVLRMGLKKLQLDSEDGRKISSAFGGGIAGLGEVCGAVTGGIFAIGLRYGRINENQTNEEVHQITQEFCQAFEKEYTYLRCSDLIFRLEIDERRKKCREMVRFATKLLFKLL